MGITWVVGVLAFHEALLPIAYVFTIMVAFQVHLISICVLPIYWGSHLLATYNIQFQCTTSTSFLNPLPTKDVH